MHLLQCEALSKVLPPPPPSANGAAMDADDVEDVSLRSIDDMAAENQRRCGQNCWPPSSERPAFALLTPLHSFCLWRCQQELGVCTFCAAVCAGYCARTESVGADGRLRGLACCRKEFMRQMNTSAYDESDDEEDGRPRGVQCAQQ